MSQKLIELFKSGISTDAVSAKKVLKLEKLKIVGGTLKAKNEKVLDFLSIHTSFSFASCRPPQFFSFSSFQTFFLALTAIS